MSHPTGLKENYKLIKECIALLEEHNKLSYKNESLVLTPIEFAMIKPKHAKRFGVIEDNSILRSIYIADDRSVKAEKNHRGNRLY